MRSFIKSVIIPLAVTLLLIGLCGCVDSTELTAYPDDLSGHVAETVEEGLVIDLDIEVPTAVLGVYAMKTLQADEEMMESFLTALSDQVASIENDKWRDGEHLYTVRTKKGGFAQFVQPRQDALAETVWTYDSPIADEYSYAVMDYYGRGRYTNVRDNTSLYLTPKEFSFGTAQEALRIARGVLQTLGLTNLDLIETLYLDHEVMSEFIKTDEAQDMLNHYGSAPIRGRVNPLSKRQA